MSRRCTITESDAFLLAFGDGGKTFWRDSQCVVNKPPSTAPSSGRGPPPHPEPTVTSDPPGEEGSRMSNSRNPECFNRADGAVLTRILKCAQSRTRAYGRNVVVVDTPFCTFCYAHITASRESTATTKPSSLYSVRTGRTRFLRGFGIRRFRRSRDGSCPSFRGRRRVCTAARVR